MKKQPAKKTSKPLAKSTVAKTVTKTAELKPTGPGVFNLFENYAEKNNKWLVWMMVALSIICSVLLFDLKVSIGGDDSSYIERAWNFLNKGTYPYYQGPGYPLVLAGIIKIFGFKLGVMKLFSLLFYTGHVIFLWYAFKKKIPYLMLLFMVGFAVVSDYMQYYASHTWSEAFYMFVQGFVLWLVMKAVSIKEPEAKWIDDLKKRWYLWLGIGVAFTFLSMTKTVAIFGIIAPILYFIIQKKYKYAIFILVSFAVIKIGVTQAEKAIYGPNPTNQLSQMMLKDAYKPAEGKLDAVGFIGRFGENLKTYSSMHFLRLLHIMPQDKYKVGDEKGNKQDEHSAAIFITLIVCAITVYSGYRIFKENKEAFFLVVFTLVMCGGIFFGIHANNRQDRLIIIVFPFILFIIMYGFYITLKNFKSVQWVLIGVMSIILLSSFYHTLAKAPESITALQKNMGNEPYYGYTEDWVNYVTMGDWCSQNLPAGSLVVCRKPTILFITTGKQMWYGVHQIESEAPDFWVNKFKEAGVTHLLLAELRAIPTKRTNRFISTIHKIYTYVVKKYPTMFKQIHIEGVQEKSILVEIDYSKV